ncbi:hypothetical protein VTK26DRAFT_727 [Humicola hyalothermophila]
MDAARSIRSPQWVSQKRSAYGASQMSTTPVTAGLGDVLQLFRSESSLTRTDVIALTGQSVIEYYFRSFCYDLVMPQVHTSGRYAISRRATGRSAAACFNESSSRAAAS